MSTPSKKQYSTKTDGSPETITYRNKVANGEIKKLGRPFLTAEEKADSRRKRMEYLATYNSKRKRRRRRHDDFLPYEEARERIQAEGIRSVAEYNLWHRLNHPAQMPQSPEDFYGRRGKWVNWGHFLGTKNSFPNIKKRTWRPFKEAKAFAHSRGFPNVQAWFAFCKTEQCPDDIPHRPDVAYFKTGEWFSWRDFLGPRCRIELGKAIEVVNDKVLYILQVPNSRTSKLYRIGVTIGGGSSIKDAMDKYGLRYIDAYVIDADFDWKKFIVNYGSPDWDNEGVYEISNINNLTLDISQYFISYQKPD